MTAPVDVLAVMFGMCKLGGRFVPEWNTGMGTGHIASKARLFRNAYGRMAMSKSPTTPTVLRALRQAEQDGLVECIGSGHCRAINASAAQITELHWRLTDNAIARISGAA